jgi:hypothetical protein
MSEVRVSFRDLTKKKLQQLLTLAFSIVMVAALPAQIVETGIITGIVKDNTSAAIPNAHVQIQNTDTGISTNTVTTAEGIFVSPPLHPGNYNVVLEAPGFKKQVEHVRLEVGQRVSADASLSIGAATDTVEVQASGQLLETDSSSIGNLRTEEAVRNLPLEGRNFAGLIGLGAGAQPAYIQITSVPYTMQRGATNFAFNGLRYQENRLLLDGIGDNENHNGLAVVIFPPIEAIQEFSEDIADADARYGRGNGGTVNLLFKSGTDQYHGDVFEFFRNTALNARNYFVTGPKNPLRENQFGVTFGGPLFWKQANPRTFFFADFAGSRLGQGQANIDSVPDFNITTTGYDFSAYETVPGVGNIHNPASPASIYPNNFIPFTDPSINVSGANVLKFYQKYASPNRPGTTIANNFQYNPIRIDNGNQFDIKIDHKFSEKDNGFFRYSQSEDSLQIPGILPTPLVGATIVGPATNPAHQFVGSETHIFSSTIINTARFGWSRFFVNAGNWDAGLNLPTQLGIPGVEVAGQPRSDGLPVFSFSGYTSIGDAANSPSQIGTNNYQTDDDVNFVHGKHSLDVGFEFVRLEYNMFQTSAEHGSGAYATRYSGLAWTDLLFGAPTSGSYSYPSGTVGLRQSDLAFYAQDNYKFNKRLTLNLGLRYEDILGWPWTEVNNKEYDFVPSISTTALEQVGTSGIPRSGLSGNNLNFAPRIGFAYQATSKTVFHAGYGIYYSAPNVTNSSGLSANVPIDNYWAFTNSTVYGAASNGAAFNYTSNGFVHPVVTSGNALVANTPAYAQDPNAKTPYSEQWHATIEQQIPFATVLKITYVGTKGVHLDHLRDINAAPITAVAGAGTIAVNRPYPFFLSINELETRQVSNYNALQVTAERRAHGVGFLVSYTYSHALDDSTGSPGTVTNPANISFDYGNADTDIPNRVVGSVTYELPFKGRGTLGGLVNGWQINSVFSFFDGTPFSVLSNAGVGDGLTPRAQLLPGFGNGSLPPAQRQHPPNGGTWFNTAAFTNAPAGTWGNTGRNLLQGPGTKDVDFSVFKNTHITERSVLQLRVETFNLANTPQFNNPGTTIGPALGKVSSAGTEPTFQRLERQVQLAAKVTF